MDEADILSAEALAALPPLPSLSEVAALYWRPRSMSEWVRLAVVVHVPSTLVYHARVIEMSEDSSGFEEYCTDLCEFTLEYDKDKQEWTAGPHRHHGWDSEGWRAQNVADNVFVEGEAESDAAPRFIVVPPTTARVVNSATSSKRRYIDLHQCSEHGHNSCYQLLPPSPPRDIRRRHWLTGRLPAVCFLPLCASCRTAIVGCIARDGIGVFSNGDDVRSIVRLSFTDYDVAVPHYLLRVNIAYERRTVSVAGGRKQAWWERMQQHTGGKRWVRLTWFCEMEEVDNYRVVAHYGQTSGMFMAEHNNVCLECQCGVTPSGKGHTERCRQGRQRQRT